MSTFFLKVFHYIFTIFFTTIQGSRKRETFSLTKLVLNICDIDRRKCDLKRTQKLVQWIICSYSESLQINVLDEHDL